MWVPSDQVGWPSIRRDFRWVAVHNCLGVGLGGAGCGVIQVLRGQEAAATNRDVVVQSVYVHEQGVRTLVRSMRSGMATSSRGVMYFSGACRITAPHTRRWS